MTTLKFKQNELVNLEYSLAREFVSTNRAGGYMSTTLTCCNTRKYHGLMVCPRSEEDVKNYVFLSSLDETIIQRDMEFNLALHKFKDVYEPKGHKYITHFDYSPTPTITYRVGGVEFQKELLWLHTHKRLLVRYTLLEASSPTKLRVRPMMAFRDVDSLSKANMDASLRSYPVKGGVRNKMYEDFPWLYLQVDTPNEFLAAPDWYYDFEYHKEKDRGYEYHEDLMTPGFFEMDIKKGQSIVLACSFREIEPEESAAQFERELARRTKKTEFIPCLKHSARQFLVYKGEDHEVEQYAGYHWYQDRSRDTFISIAGCTLVQDLIDECVNVLRRKMNALDGGLFEDGAVDTPLWFFATLQQLRNYTTDRLVWENFSKYMKQIINAYGSSLKDRGVEMHDNALIWAKRDGFAMTWMNGYVDGKPVTERGGYQVEVNALWYNALCFTLSLANKFCDSEFVDKWSGYPEKIKSSFVKMFWNDRNRCLADYVDGAGQNVQIRPNQIIACGLENIMLDDILAREVINCVEQNLLTPKGLRTLSPRDSMYEPVCEGSETSRNMAYHNGTVWSWLLLLFLLANKRVFGEQFKAKAQEMINNYRDEFLDHGIGTVAEMYDANPPYQQRGAVSSAMSVGTLLRMVRIAEY